MKKKILYVKFKEFIKNNYKAFIIYFLLLIVLTYRLPYYVYTGGGIMNSSDKINIEKRYNHEGTLNFAYVEERNATIPVLLLSLFNDNWDVIKEEEYKLNNNETTDDIQFRNKLDLESANSNALYVAFKSAEKDIKEKNRENYITYISEEANTDLKIGDIIIEIDGKKINNLKDITTIIENKNIEEKLTFKVLRNDKTIECYAHIYSDNNKKMVGISVTTIYNYETNPEVKFNFSSRESGPSGGLILALTIYNEITEYDITKGLKIVGTGTIDREGKIGAIGGVKYKLAGAVEEKADIFIVPNDLNYDECIKLKEKNNYDIEIIGVNTFEDALTSLRNFNK